MLIISCLFSADYLYPTSITWFPGGQNQAWMPNTPSYSFVTGNPSVSISAAPSVDSALLINGVAANSSLVALSTQQSVAVNISAISTLYSCPSTLWYLISVKQLSLQLESIAVAGSNMAFTSSQLSYKTSVHAQTTAVSVAAYSPLLTIGVHSRNMNATFPSNFSRVFSVPNSIDMLVYVATDAASVPATVYTLAIAYNSQSTSSASVRFVYFP